MLNLENLKPMSLCKTTVWHLEETYPPYYIEYYISQNGEVCEIPAKYYYKLGGSNIHMIGLKESDMADLINNLRPKCVSIVNRIYKLSSRYYVYEAK